MNYIRVYRAGSLHSRNPSLSIGAEDEIRTRDPRLGKAMLYP